MIEPFISDVCIVQQENVRFVNSFMQMSRVESLLLLIYQQ